MKEELERIEVKVHKTPYTYLQLVVESDQYLKSKENWLWKDNPELLLKFFMDKFGTLKEDVPFMRVGQDIIMYPYMSVDSLLYSAAKHWGFNDTKGYFEFVLAAFSDMPEGVAFWRKGNQIEKMPNLIELREDKSVSLIPEHEKES